MEQHNILLGQLVMLIVAQNLCPGLATQAAGSWQIFNDPAENGVWTEWEPWKACSATCGSGASRRRRDCTNPKPVFGHPQCKGAPFESKRCSAAIECPIDGAWSNWEMTSDCSIYSCGIERPTLDGSVPCNRVYGRSCDNPAPEHGGVACVGDSVQVDENIVCPYVECPDPEVVKGSATAKGKWSVQATSYFDSDTSKYDEEQAIDGEYKHDTNNFWHPKVATTWTDWLQVDFGEKKGIYRVILFGRSDLMTLIGRLNYLEVRIGAEMQPVSPRELTSGDNPLCGRLERTEGIEHEEAPRNGIVECSDYFTGQFMTVQKKGPAETTPKGWEVVEIFVQEEYQVTEGDILEGVLCFYYGSAYDGTVITSITSITNERDCQNNCQANSECNSFTFDVTANRCYLKTPELTQDMLFARSHVIAGPRNCQVPLWQPWV